MTSLYLLENGDRTQSGRRLHHRHDLLVPNSLKWIGTAATARRLLGRRQTGILFDPIGGGTAEPGLRRRNGNGVVLTEGHVHPHLVIGDMTTWQATDPTARL